MMKTGSYLVFQPCSGKQIAYGTGSSFAKILHELTFMWNLWEVELLLAESRTVVARGWDTVGQWGGASGYIFWGGLW